MNLDELRAEITDLDGKILELVARRQKVSEQVASVKRAAGRGTRDFGRERDVITRARATAARLGISENLAESILRQLIQSSLTTQEHARVQAQAHGSGKSALVIGGCGKMGGWFTEFLSSQGFRVTIADPGPGGAGYERIDDWQNHALDFDLIVLATPLSATAELLEVLARRAPRGLVFDLGSLKTPLRAGLDALVRAGVRVTSVHPMFGPDTELLSGRHVIFIDLGNSAALAEAQALFAPTMAERVVMDLDEHDRLIAYVLGLSHALNIAFFTALADSGEEALRLAKLSSTTFDSQLDVASRVAAESPELYYEIQSANDYGSESLLALQKAVERVIAAVKTRNAREFASLMTRGRAYLETRASARQPAKEFMEDLTQEIDDLKKRLAEMTAEAANNETIMRRTQARELSLLRADSLAQLLHAMVDGLRESYSLDAISVVLVDPQHEIRHLLIAGGDRPEEFKQIFFVDSLVGLAPQLASLHKPWLGPFIGADHHLLFPGGQNLKSAALLPLPRKDRATGALCFASRDPARFTRHHATDFLAHLGAVAAVCIENATNRARLLRAGITDFLTGWHNRRYLQGRLKEELGRAQRRGGTISCLMIDIDKFKSINDGYGHLAGDAVLKEVAHRVESQIRSMDTAARFGGDELCILMPETSQTDAAHLADRIREVIAAQPFALNSQISRNLTISVGVAALTPSRNDSDLKALADRLVADADAALYRAKALGRNRVQLGA